jgi:hypothetical protein
VCVCVCGGGGVSFDWPVAVGQLLHCGQFNNKAVTFSPACTQKQALLLISNDKLPNPPQLLQLCLRLLFYRDSLVPSDSNLTNTYKQEPRYLRQYSVWLRAGRSGFDPRQGQRIFLLAPASRSDLGPTQPPVQWVAGVFSPGVKRGRGVTLTTHPHLVPRLRMSRSYTSSHPMRPHGM